MCSSVTSVCEQRMSWTSALLRRGNHFRKANSHADFSCRLAFKIPVVLEPIFCDSTKHRYHSSLKKLSGKENSSP
uniref:Uncharacterized protein n=1 Tax=Arundo donax TaxID=35708 RepID=A0A0A9CUC0_ARUDO